MVHQCQEYRKIIASLPSKLTGRTNEFEQAPNGVPAREGEFPHQVRVGQWFYEDEESAFILRCSGALISDRYVLVSAHCFWALGDNEVSLGRHDYTRNASLPELLVEREDIVLQPGNDEPTKTSYDGFGLVRLAKPVNFTSNIYPACLWTDDAPVEPQHLTVAGFTLGKLVNDTQDTRLAKIRMSRIPNEECAREYANSSRMKEGITDAMLCAKSSVGWRTLCEGDAGLLLQTLDGDSSDVYRVIGVQGKNQQCDQTHDKFFFPRVQKQLDWIESVVWGG
uniref:Peptidase S1 domain-containing protein n=1 Tax=Anopheles epiroticus TaxID=199890 RepID=A0A182P8Z9_9DIPT